MFRLLRKSLFHLHSRCSFISSSQVRRLLIRFPVRDFSSSPSPRSHWKRIKEDEYNLRVSVWWDFETCGVPSGVRYSKVAPSVTGALRTKGFTGPIHIQAYGNVYQLSEINQEILFSTGIDLHHIPGGRSSSHRFLVDWIFQNPPRGHLLLISGDRDYDFVVILNRLSMISYSILSACPSSVDPFISGAATIAWQWSEILEGKNLANLDDDC